MIKALATLTSERSELLPDLPTAKEKGVNATDGYYWMGFWFPAGTPQEIVNKMNGGDQVSAEQAGSQSPPARTSCDRGKRGSTVA
ncbi:MAG: tripartite tricarboxylate transporter substrate-binding protein [Bradyrhizobium sp.]